MREELTDEQRKLDDERIEVRCDDLIEDIVLVRRLLHTSIDLLRPVGTELVTAEPGPVEVTTTGGTPAAAFPENRVEP